MGVIAPTHPRVSSTTPSGPRSESWMWTGLVIVALTAFIGVFLTVGGDVYWLVALGDDIARHGRIPSGIPFAAAPSSGWPNVLVLAELLLSGVHALGSSALAIMQAAVDAGALLAVAVGARRQGASDRSTAAVLVILVFGALPSFAIVALQTLSLVPFALLLLLLRADACGPDRRIWCLPLLVAVWGNLHGAVLVGVAVAGCYLVISRLHVRPLETLAVASTTLVALFANPATYRTAHYYLGVMDSEAAREHAGLWRELRWDNAVDVLMMAAGVALLLLLLRWKRPLWEYLALAALAIATVTAARYGIWLLMAAAPAAAASFRSASPTLGALPDIRRTTIGVIGLASVLAASVVLVPRGDGVLEADPAVVRAVVAEVGGRVVLAPEPLVESLEQARVKVWAGNPIDAFSRNVQRAYVDFQTEGPLTIDAVNQVGAVIVGNDAAAHRVMSGLRGWTRKRVATGWTLYLRRFPRMR